MNILNWINYSIFIFVLVILKSNVTCICFVIIPVLTFIHWRGPSWSYDSWIYNYLCNQCLSPWRGVLDTTLCDTVCHWLTTGGWFSPGTPVSSTNKTDLHDITEILLKMALNIITPNSIQSRMNLFLGQHT